MDDKVIRLAVPRNDMCATVDHLKELVDAGKAQAMAIIAILDDDTVLSGAVVESGVYTLLGAMRCMESEIIQSHTVSD